ncbi:MAG: DNA mismatch repair endonuclease MutL [Erysipelotrichales bacterium]|nr:DNA mismatch repair endonuclease MutL [Erysipelotrichales bacterium]
MGKIQVLDTKLANMIAAGEVVERPSSVLKELVENSIDAHSKNVSVYVYDAGRKKIVIEDDGDGMDRDDALTSLKRHATSKISSSFDLFRIKTLGFRGEALPSIASVSKMKITTSTGVGVGTELIVINEEATVNDAPLRKGTVVEVEELFYNTPARLKFLKTDYTENANNIEVMSRIAMAHPEVSIKFYIDDKKQFATTGRGDLLEVIANIYGYQSAKSMVPFSFEAVDFKVTGFLGKPDIAKASRYYTITLLNGRNVYMPKVQKAITDAYSDFIPPSKYPFVVLNFEVDFALVDVNVHPAKREVRFSKEEELRLALLEHIPGALRPKTIFDEIEIKKDRIVKEEIEHVSLFDENELNNASQGNVVVKFKELEVKENIVPEDLFEDEEIANVKKEDLHDEKITEISEEVKKETRKVSPIKPLAQLNKTYIIGEDYDNSQGGFYLIDQHAAMERINYEYFSRLYAGKITTMQPLFPEVIHLRPSDVKLFTEDIREMLKAIGLEFEPFGLNTYKVVTIPTWIRKDDEKEYIDELLEMALHEDKLDTFKLQKHAIATMACKASLKANMNCTMEEAKVMLDRLFNCENPHNCPHGRPIIIKFSKYELEKLFKRTGV